MIDSCGLHIGCFLTCTSGVNTLTVELLATVSGTHTIEYHFLSRVIRFEIEATIGLPFEIPTTYFNESGDARIKIVLPNGTYFTHTVGTKVYDTFYLTVKTSTDANFVPAVIPPVVSGIAVPVNYSLSEQVWPYETWFGQTIYWRTWDLGTDDGFPKTLTGFPFASVTRVVKTQLSHNYTLTTDNWESYSVGISQDSVTIPILGADNIMCTVWYVKA